MCAPHHPAVTETEKLLEELVALPSVNPACLPPGHPWAGEKAVADFLAATVAQAGLDVAFEPALPGRPNLLATLSPRGKARRRVLLAPHLDTVGGSEEQFKPRSRRGRLYARGACDTKGSVAAMVTALGAVARSGRRPRHTEIVFAGLVDEECGQGGSRALVANGFKADLAIVGEPTQLQVVTAHKGLLWLDFETRGQAAHGACPERGHNAVHEMARIIDMLQTDYAAELRSRPRHPLLGSATVNVGVIHGGSQPNIVPASCTASVDRRTLPGESSKGVRMEIAALLRSRGLQARVTEVKRQSCPPLETDARLDLVRRFFQAAGQRRPVGVDYFSDASVLAMGTAPSVVFGPGDIAQAHTADEWVSLSAVESAAQLLKRYLLSLP